MKRRITKIYDDDGGPKAIFESSQTDGGDMPKEDHEKLMKQVIAASNIVKTSVSMCPGLTGVDIRNMPTTVLNIGAVLADDLINKDFHNGKKQQALAQLESLLNTLGHMSEHFSSLRKEHSIDENGEKKDGR